MNRFFAYAFLGIALAGVWEIGQGKIEELNAMQEEPYPSFLVVDFDARTVRMSHVNFNGPVIFKGTNAFSGRINYCRWKNEESIPFALKLQGPAEDFHSLGSYFEGGRILIWMDVGYQDLHEDNSENPSETSQPETP